MPALPYNIEDAASSEVEIDKALQVGEQLVPVNQDTHLNFRVLDLHTPSNQGIFRIQCQVENIFRQFLLSEGFVGIYTPKLIAGSSEGGLAVFRLDYKGQPACLAQSPQLHKQMAICGGFGRVFEVGAVFRVEDSFTHRQYLCEFTGLDVEMEIKEHYSEVWCTSTWWFWDRIGAHDNALLCTQQHPQNFYVPSRPSRDCSITFYAET